MGKLHEILNRNKVKGITEEIEISERLKYDDGKLLKFKIEPITTEKLAELRKKAASIDKKGNMTIDEVRLTNLIAIECTAEPSFRDAEAMKEIGCTTPEQYINAVLLAGEIDTLTKEIMKLSGFDSTIEEMRKEIKN